MSQDIVNKTPLFPLGKVVFPCIPVQLKIFEQRYLKMIGDVLKSDGVFGVVPIVKGREVGVTPDIYPFGTLVSICDWQQLPNGLLGITVKGEQRFEVAEFSVNSQQLMQANITLFEEDTSTMSDESHQRLLSLLETLTTHPLTQHLKITGDVSLYELSWLLAELVPFEKDTGLELLKMPENEKRLDMISNLLGRMMS